jgi:hypothetical protein
MWIWDMGLWTSALLLSAIALALARFWTWDSRWGLKFVFYDWEIGIGFTFCDDGLGVDLWLGLALGVGVRLWTS